MNLDWIKKLTITASLIVASGLPGTIAEAVTL